MCEISFISEFEVELRYKSVLDVLFPRPIPRMLYDLEKREIRIRDLIGMSVTHIYQLLCHEILHAVLHKVEGRDVCIKLDNLSDVIDGKYAYIWMGEDYEKHLKI